VGASALRDGRGEAPERRAPIREGTGAALRTFGRGSGEARAELVCGVRPTGAAPPIRALRGSYPKSLRVEAKPRRWRAGRRLSHPPRAFGRNERTKRVRLVTPFVVPLGNTYSTEVATVSLWSLSVRAGPPQSALQSPPETRRHVVGPSLRPEPPTLGPHEESRQGCYWLVWKERRNQTSWGALTSQAGAGHARLASR